MQRWCMFWRTYGVWFLGNKLANLCAVFRWCYNFWKFLWKTSVPSRASYSKNQNGNKKISQKKRSFFQEKINFLGHVTSEEGVATDPDKIEATKDWHLPRTIHEVQSFIGTCSNYRRYIRWFLEIARQLHKLTEKESVLIGHRNANKR